MTTKKRYGYSLVCIDFSVHCVHFVVFFYRAGADENKSVLMIAIKKPFVHCPSFLLSLLILLSFSLLDSFAPYFLFHSFSISFVVCMSHWLVFVISASSVQKWVICCWKSYGVWRVMWIASNCIFGLTETMNGPSLSTLIMWCNRTNTHTHKLRENQRKTSNLNKTDINDSTSVQHCNNNHDARCNNNFPHLSRLRGIATLRHMMLANRCVFLCFFFVLQM